MKIYRTSQYALDLPSGHRFPAEKYALIEAAVAGFAADLLVDAPMISAAELKAAHAADYVDQVFTGQLTRAQERLIGLPWNPALLQRSLFTTGATLAACRTALVEGCGVNLAGGTHHAYADHGSGFCVFNDTAVALINLLQAGQITRALVIDLDVHQGNGTAALLADYPQLYTFSMHGAGNFPFQKEASDWDIELADHSGDAHYLDTLAAALPQLFVASAPDLVIYLAGADPYQGDRLGRLNLSIAGLAARDTLVMDWCQRFATPLAITLAGGYAEPIADTVAIQTQTVALAYARYGQEGKS